MVDVKVIKDSNIWDDMTEDRQKALADILDLLTDKNYLGGNEMYRVSYDRQTKVMNLITEEWERYASVWDETRIIARLLNIPVGTVMWFEDVLDLAKIVYKKKNEKFDPDKLI